MRSSLWLVPCLSLTLVAEAPLPLSAPIRRVRLHPDEAWVTRSGEARLVTAGVHRLMLADLPQGLGVDDVRVAAKGPEGTRLGDLSLAADPRKLTETADYKTLRGQWETARDRVDALEAEGDALAREAVFLNGLQAAYDKDLSARLGSAPPQAAAVVDLSKGLEGRTVEVLTRDRRRRRELETARDDFRRLDAELKQRAAERSASPSRAVVEVSVPRAGEVTVEFTYRVRKARWTAAYEARLAADGRKLDLALYANVRQDTGEDWSGVQVEITNARASRSLAVARYDGPVTVGCQANELLDAVPLNGRNFTEVVALAPGVTQNTMLPRATMAAPAPPKPAQEAEAVPLEEARGLASAWALEGGKDIPADNEPHRFRVLGRELAPELGLVATPRLDPTVVRVARFPVPEGLPLFPGAPVVHYAGSQRIGQAPLALPAAGLPFQFGFGPYRGVRVELRRLDARKDTVGTFSKESQWTLKERIEVANDTAEPVRVELLDRDLRAASDKVKLTPTADAAPAKDGGLPGVRRWDLDVPARGKAGVALGVQIRIPAGQVLTGLEGLNLPD